MMEPTVLGEGYRFRGRVTDLAFELTQKSSGFKRSLPKHLLASLADLVRSMNCYYSNLIEGHDTHPIDIERALKNDYSNDAKKRDLQLEARAPTSRFSSGLTTEDSARRVRSAPPPFVRSIGASASCCPKTSCGLRIRTRRNESG